MSTPAIVGLAIVGGFRIGVFTTDFDRAVTTFERATRTTTDVTLRALTLGSRDSTTGWRAVTYSTSTITMPILSKGSTQVNTFAGAYCYEDAVGVTQDVVEPGQQLLQGSSRYFEIQSLRQVWMGDSFNWRECQLVNRPMWQAAPGTTTWSKTRPNDPRERTKVYIDTYARVAQITKDDDSTQATWACIFANPPYPLYEEFRASTSPVQGLYVVEMPTSEALLDCDYIPYGYVEHVPIHICTVDSTGCTGTALNWKMEAELRYACETQPLGSRRSLENRVEDTVTVGNVKLYDTRFTLNYRRDKS